VVACRPNRITATVTRQSHPNKSGKLIQTRNVRWTAASATADMCSMETPHFDSGHTPPALRRIRPATIRQAGRCRASGDS
jgi:hypothetical protein